MERQFQHPTNPNITNNICDTRRIKERRCNSATDSIPEQGVRSKIPEEWQIDTQFVHKLSGIDFFPKDFFRMFNVLPYSNIKVVIMGQNPYTNPRHACGIAFLVPDDVIKCPVTLKVLIKELEDDIGVSKKKVRDVIKEWTQKGVFLTNCSLTNGLNCPDYLKDHSPFWKEFVIQFIKTVSQLQCPIVFLGENAWKFEKYCSHSKVLKFYYPTSRNDKFVGCKMFTKINDMLNEPIEWI